MKRHIAIIGAGFTGLATARDLARAGHPVTLFEADETVGGLAGSFLPKADGAEPLDRFYHHWFTSDREVQSLVHELGMSDGITEEASLTGVYIANRTLRLSTPLDLLRFPALRFSDRIRLGMLALRARRVRDWRALEGVTAADWLRRIGGDRVYRTVWEPLLAAKFGSHADTLSAVWIWNKLKLRGGSRGKGGEERLAYLRGSFCRLADAMAQDIRHHGGTLRLSAEVTRLTPDEKGHWQIETTAGPVTADAVVATIAPPLVSRMIGHWATPDTRAMLDRVDYLANLCLVLELDRSLGSTYWLNVNDPGFPFVGVIEHTNFQPSELYGGRHIVYLSRYLDATDPVYGMPDEAVLDYALLHLKRMFPAFRRDWVQAHHVWRARWAQPVVERNYSRILPAEDGPAEGLYLCSMAQIYPEDRGTNYAVREGRRIAARLISEG